jgi:uncharacterized iron-regulated membrane protein
MKKYVVITCLIGLPGFINLMLCGVMAFDYWLIPNPQDSMIHRALTGVVNEPLVAIGSTCSLLFFFMIVPILFLVARNGAKIEELEKQRQAYHDARLELKGLKEKYLKLIAAGMEKSIEINNVASSQVFVIMFRGSGNVLAWSSQCWPTRDAAQENIDNIAQGEEEYRKKYWIMPLNIIGK